MKAKTYLKEASIVSVYDYKDFDKIFLVDVLAGVVNEDETFRFRPYQQIVTSKIVSKRTVGEKIEITTHSGSYYVIDVEHKLFDISFVELVVMRTGGFSPERVIELRELLKNRKDLM